jgi:hypothetical protein
MKRLFLLLLLFPFAFAHAQGSVFLRVYNANGKKISKGYLVSLSDTSITLIRKATIIKESPVSHISVIKSKRTTGHRVMVITASVAGAVFLLAGTVWANKNGSAPGFFNSGSGRKKHQSIRPLPPPKPFKKYKIGGSAQNWQHQKAYLVLLY